jgi:hypothetical protein
MDESNLKNDVPAFVEQQGSRSVLMNSNKTARVESGNVLQTLNPSDLSAFEKKPDQLVMPFKRDEYPSFSFRDRYGEQ